MSNTTTGDAYTHSSDVYPYNVVPQSRSPKPHGPMPKLKCPPDDNKQFILMDVNQHLSVVKGFETKSFLDLKEFFVPVDNYQLYEFVLKYDGNFDNYITLNYGNMGNPVTGILFVCIYPMYMQTDLDDQNRWKIHWRYIDDPVWTATGQYGGVTPPAGYNQHHYEGRHNDDNIFEPDDLFRNVEEDDEPQPQVSGYYTPSSAEDESTWRQLGRLMVLSGTNESLIKPIHLQNRTGEDVPIKILIGS